MLLILNHFLALPVDEHVLCVKGGPRKVGAGAALKVYRPYVHATCASQIIRTEPKAVPNISKVLSVMCVTGCDSLGVYCTNV